MQSRYNADQITEASCVYIVDLTTSSPVTTMPTHLVPYTMTLSFISEVMHGVMVLVRSDL